MWQIFPGEFSRGIFPGKKRNRPTNYFASDVEYGADSFTCATAGNMRNREFTFSSNARTEGQMLGKGGLGAYHVDVASSRCVGPGIAMHDITDLLMPLQWCIKSLDQEG
jgi:hypothetical protein